MLFNIILSGVALLVAGFVSWKQGVKDGCTAIVRKVVILLTERGFNKDEIDKFLNHLRDTDLSKWEDFVKQHSDEELHETK